MMVIVEFVVLMGILLYSLYRIFQILWGMAKQYFRVAKVCPGAMEAYEMLRQSARQGEVSDEVLERAVSLMRSKGASAEDAFQFLCRCCAMSDEDVQKIRSAVERCERNMGVSGNVPDGLNG